MKRLIIALSTVVFVSACGDSGENQNDPVNSAPPQQPNAAAPADKDPTPQTGTGGQSPATSPSGTTNTPPANTAPSGANNP